MTILVTGGTGFIGHVVVKMLQSKFIVHSYDNATNYGVIDSGHINSLHGQRRIGIRGQKIIGDIRNSRNLASVLFVDQPSTVIHLAGFPRANIVDADPTTAADVMVTSLINFLHQCKEYNVKRFVYISSSMVYGDFESGATEDHICNPKSLYGILKLAGEMIVKDFCTKNGIDYVIVRPSAVYGPLDVNDRVIAKFLTNAKAGHSISVKGPNEVLDFTYVDDIAAGICLAATHSAAKNNTYNMTRGLGYTLLEAAELVVKITNSNSRVTETARDKSFPRRGSLSNEKAMTELGYAPTVNLKEGLTKYAEWLAQ